MSFRQHPGRLSGGVDQTGLVCGVVIYRSAVDELGAAGVDAHLKEGAALLFKQASTT